MRTMLSSLVLAGEVDARSIHDIIEQRRGKMVVVQLWATWCVACVKELPIYVRLQHERDDIAVVSISIDDRANRPVVEELIVAHDLPFPVYLKAGEAGSTFVEGVDREWSGVVPATLVFDREGRRTALIKGEHDRRVLDRVLGVVERRKR
jgi:thiol-disulfide isomerase/thioredoxin